METPGQFPSDQKTQGAYCRNSGWYSECLESFQIVRISGPSSGCSTQEVGKEDPGIHTLLTMPPVVLVITHFGSPEIAEAKVQVCGPLFLLVVFLLPNVLPSCPLGYMTFIALSAICPQIPESQATHRTKPSLTREGRRWHHANHSRVLQVGGP